MKDLADVLAEVRANADTADRILPQQGIGATLRLVAKDIEAAASDFLVWVDERDATLRCGHHVRWLRARFPQWQAAGHAMKIGRRRMYRRIVVPEKHRAGI